MTIASVLLNFRSALLAIMPAVERAGISWKRPNAYDEWDVIATTLFDKLVIDVLRWSLPRKEREGFLMPSYDLLLSTYADSSTLEVVHSLLPDGRWLFHAFGTGSEPFDIVEVRLLADDGRPLAEDLASCPVDGAGFRLRLAQGPEVSRLVEEVKMFDD